MKRIFIAIALLCAGISAGAQNTGKLYWGERDIRISDYAAITDPSSNTDVYSAIGWDLSQERFRSGNLVIFHPSYRAFFDLRKSQAVTSRVTPALLEYQQLVFDVAELYGRRLAKASTNNSIGGVDLSRVHQANMNKDLQEYADITFNGSDAERVKQCRKKVAGQLASETKTIPVPSIGQYNIGMGMHLGFSTMGLLEYAYTDGAISGPHNGLDFGLDVLFGNHSLGLNVTGTTGNITAPGYYMDRDWTAGTEFDMTLATIQYSINVLDTDYWELAPTIGFGQINYYHLDSSLPREESSVYNTGLTANAGVKCRFKYFRSFSPYMGTYNDTAIYGKVYGSATKIHGGIPIFLGIHFALGLDFNIGSRRQ